MVISFFPELISWTIWHLVTMVCCICTYEKFGDVSNAPRKLRHRKNYIYESFKIFKEFEMFKSV